MTKYETKRDRTAEDYILRAVAAYKGWGYKQLPEFYPVDGAFHGSVGDRNVIGFAEVKRRYVPMNKYDTFFIDLTKVATGLSLARLIAVPFYICVGWDDFVGMMHTPSPFKGFDTTIEGRRDRGDVNDIEPVIHFPITKFTIVRRLFK